jgi:anti-anti-sigma regulatory factor
MPGNHHVQATAIDGAWVLALPDALVADIEPDLLAAAAPVFAPAARLVVLDLGAVQYANSAGVGALVVLLQRARDAGIPVRFAAVAGQPLVVLERVGLARYAGTFATVREALEAV